MNYNFSTHRSKCIVTNSSSIGSSFAFYFDSEKIVPYSFGQEVIKKILSVFFDNFNDLETSPHLVPTKHHLTFHK